MRRGYGDPREAEGFLVAQHFDVMPDVCSRWHSMGQSVNRVFLSESDVLRKVCGRLGLGCTDWAASSVASCNYPIAGRFWLAEVLRAGLEPNL